MVYPVLGWIFGWLWRCTLTWSNWGWGEGGGWKFHFPTCSINFLYQGILSNKKFSHKKKWYFHHNWGRGGSPLCGGHHPKVPFFFLTPPLNKLLLFITLVRTYLAETYVISSTNIFPCGSEILYFRSLRPSPTLLGRKLDWKTLCGLNRYNCHLQWTDAIFKETRVQTW